MVIAVILWLIAVVVFVIIAVVIPVVGRVNEQVECIVVEVEVFTLIGSH